MGSFADYWEGKTLDHLFSIAAYTAPDIYVGLSTADPTDDASGLAEPSGGSYARVLHAAWARSGSIVDNTGTVTFPTSTASWGNLTHFALFDALSGGNMLGHGTLDSARNVDGADYTPQFADGELDVTLD